MKTHFLATTALALSLALPTALAAQTSGTTGTTETMQSKSSTSQTVIIDDGIVGKDLYGANDAEVGEIEDVVMGQDGKVESVLVDVGGFLGMGAKRVAIPVDEIEMSGERVVSSSLTKERAESMPEHEGSTARVTDTQRTTTTTGAATGAAGTSAATTGTGTAATGTAGTGAATTGTGTTATTAEFTIDRTVVGKDLYGSNDEEVGEIEDVVMGTGGDVESVLIDVGGFLGLGAKRIAIPVDQITMEGDRIVASGLTKDAAEAMPEYKD